MLLCGGQATLDTGLQDVPVLDIPSTRSLMGFDLIVLSWSARRMFEGCAQFSSSSARWREV